MKWRGRPEENSSPDSGDTRIPKVNFREIATVNDLAEISTVLPIERVGDTSDNAVPKNLKNYFMNELR